MSDKVNMSLDDIIELNKKARKATNTRVQGKGARAVLAGRGAKQNKGRKVAAAAGRRLVRGSVRKAPTGGPVGNQKKLLQNLVKKAVKKALMGGASRQMATTRRGADVRQPNILNRLSGINQRSRLIQRRPNLAQRRPNQVQRIVQSRRPRQQIRAPIPQVTQIVEKIIERPVIRQSPRQGIRRQPVQVIREIVQQPQQRLMQPARIQRLQRAPRQRMFVQRVQQPRQRVQQVVQRIPRVQRVQTVPARQRQRVMVVERNVPRVQNRIIRRPVQVVRRPVQHIQYVEVEPPRHNIRRQNSQLGGGRGGNKSQEDRFEPSSSFISNRTIVRKGRGFQNRF